MYQHVTSIKNNLFKFKVDLTNYHNIEKISNGIKEINSIEPFNRHIPELSSTIQEVQKWFLNSITKTLTLIEDTFSLKSPQNTISLNLCHIKTAECAFNYLNNCKKIDFPQINVNDLLIRLENMIQKYSDTIGKELDSIYSNICNNSNKEDCKILYNRGKELTMMNRYSEVSSRINYNENLFEKMQKKLENYYNELSEELQTLALTNQITTIHAKIEIIKTLRNMDEIFENKKFQSLYRDYSKILQEHVPKVLTDIETATKNNDYSTLFEILSDLSNSKDALFQTYFEKSKKIILSEINSCKEETETSNRFFINSINEENSTEKLN